MQKQPLELLSKINLFSFHHTFSPICLLLSEWGAGPSGGLGASASVCVRAGEMAKTLALCIPWPEREQGGRESHWRSLRAKVLKFLVAHLLCCCNLLHVRPCILRHSLSNLSVGLALSPSLALHLSSSPKLKGRVKRLGH